MALAIRDRGLGALEQKRPEFLAVSPNGRIPANVFNRYFPEKIASVIDRYQKETRRLYE